MRSFILLGIAILLVTLSVYWQTGNHEFVNLDDDVYVYENPHLATGLTGTGIRWAFSSIYASNWHPITWLSHMADFQLYGLNPRGHHLTNVACHTAATLVLFVLLFRMTNSPWQSAFVAALFALHPLHVESVAWVAERKNVLSAFWGFLCLLLYTEYATKRKRGFYLLSLLAFIIGLMSKPMLVTFPAIMLLFDFWPLNRYAIEENLPGERQWYVNMSLFKSLVREKIPFFICSLASSIITIYAQQQGGSMQALDVVPLGERLANAATAYMKYVYKALWPVDLAVYYPFPTQIPLWQVVCSVLFLLAVTAAIMGVGRRQPCLAVGWLWFIITLLPVIGLIQVGAQAMADRYTYIPLVGLFIAVAGGIASCTKKFPAQKIFLVLLGSFLILTSAALTWKQIKHWQNSISLYEHTIAVTSGSSLVYNNLGIALYDRGRVAEAIENYNKSIKISPDNTKAYNNLGIAFASRGDLDGAIEQYKKAIEKDPTNSIAHKNLSLALARKKMLIKE